MSERQWSRDEPRLFLVGPTASGKSGVAFEIAEITKNFARPVRLISLDSMLVYRGLDIVTAKPTAAELARHPVAAIDIADPAESFSVARFVAFAEQAACEIVASGARPLFVGGTGLYLKAMTHGLFEGPPSHPELRMQYSERARREGVELLHAELAAADPAAAAKIHPRDEKRIIRALEVFVTTGKPISQLQSQWSEAHGRTSRIALLKIEPGELRARMAARIDWMLQNDVAGEIRRVAASGLSREASAAVGVREILDFLAGNATEAQVREQMLKRTRELARRQGTWYRSYEGLHAIEAGAPRTVAEIAADVMAALGIEESPGSEPADIEPAGNTPAG